VSLTVREELAERFGEDLLFADGLDDALIGVSLRFGREPIALYDRKKVIALFMAEHVCDCEPRCEEGEECPQAWEQAEEHFGFNVIGAWVGDTTPAYAELTTTKLDDDQKAGAARNHFLAGDSTYQTTGYYCAGRDAWDAAIKWARENR
jgi:hypothetical protein